MSSNNVPPVLATTIGQLPMLNNLLETAIIPVSQGGATYGVTPDQIVASAGFGGTVTSVTVATAHGFAGAVTDPTGAADITLSTTVAGIVKGDGTSLSQATVGHDYSNGTAALATGILKSTTTTGVLSIATAGDFPTLNQNTTGNAATATLASTATLATNVTTNANSTGVITSIGNVTSFGSFTSAQFAAGCSDETGTGVVVLGTNPTINTPNIVGVSTNSNAAAGSVGEYVQNYISSVSPLAVVPATATNLTSISLTAGDWDVAMEAHNVVANAATMSLMYSGISLITAAFDFNSFGFSTWLLNAFLTGDGSSITSPNPCTKRISLATTTTIYAVVYHNSSANSNFFGGIWARRRR